MTDERLDRGDGLDSLALALAELEPADWPALAVADRLIERLARTLAGDHPPVGGSSTGPDADRRRAGRRRAGRRRPVRRRVIVALSAAVAVLLAVAVIVAVAGSGGGPARQPAATHPRAVASAPPWRLVDSVSSPFDAVGQGPQTGNLACASATTCYVTTVGGSPSDPTPAPERTTDGGATWQPLAPLPDGLRLGRSMSCPSAEDCVADAAAFLSPAPTLHLVVTTDAGSDWRAVTMAPPAGVPNATIDQVACATVEHCVVHIVGDRALGGTPVGAFVVTDDGGATWTRATSVSPDVADPLWALRCAADGTCLAVAGLGATHASGSVAALRSTDGGRTWTAEPPALTFGMGTVEAMCGDTSHCLLVYPGPTGGITVGTTGDGGATWRSGAAPSTWPDVGIAASCASGGDCWVSLADSSPMQGYDHPAIESTTDGGTTWTSLPLPAVNGSSLALVYPLSCPTAAGCIGVGATPAEFAPPVTPTGPTTTQTAQRVIVSNLAG